MLAGVTQEDPPLDKTPKFCGRKQDFKAELAALEPGVVVARGRATFKMSLHGVLIGGKRLLKGKRTKTTRHFQALDPLLHCRFYLGPTADKADRSWTHGVERVLDGQQKHMLVGGPRAYVDNICMYVHQGRLQTGGAAARNNFPLLLRLPTLLQPPPTIQLTN